MLGGSPSKETISLNSEQIKNYGLSRQPNLKGILSKNFNTADTQMVDQASIKSNEQDSLHGESEQFQTNV